MVFIFLVFWGSTVDVQFALSPGDMGRDLYAFQRTFLGEMPGRDFWWQYGPLMPLYHAFWFLLGGVNLISVRIGLGVILFFSSLLTYRTLRLFVSPPFAFLPSLPYLSIDITHTFNHVGAFPFMLWTVFSLWQFFIRREIQWCYFAMPALISIALVKISAGMASLFAFAVVLCLDCFFSRLEGEAVALGRRLRHIFFLALIFVVAGGGVYYWMLRGLSLSQVDHCFTLTVGEMHRQRWNLTPWTNVKHLIQWFLIWDRRRLLSMISLIVLVIFGLCGLRRKKISVRERRLYLRVVSVPILIGLANAVDYFVDGRIQRFDFWLLPMLFLLIGLLAQWAGSLFAPRVKIVLGWLTLFFVLWLPFQNIMRATSLRTPERYLDLPHGKVYMGGPLSNVLVIKKGAHYLIENTRAEDQILAIPYDALYCFLSERRHAVRELMFMEHMQVSGKEEDEMIRQIQAKRPPLFILSNRYRSAELGMGTFGETHYRKLAQYLFEHYREVQTFGPWDGISAGLHAVKIFKRI